MESGDVRKTAATSSGEPASAAANSAIRAPSALLPSARWAQWVKNLVLPLPFLFGAALGTMQAGRWFPTGGRNRIFWSTPASVLR